MPFRNPALRFEDILENISRIERYTAGMDIQDLAVNSMRADAIERCLARISEAAVKPGEDAERLCPEFPWRDIRGLGNRLRHEYTTVDFTRIMLVVEKDLAGLKDSCGEALRRIDRGRSE